LIAKIEHKTKGLDIGLLVNNVGIISLGTYGNQNYNTIFNMLNVNCATPSVL